MTTAAEAHAQMHELPITDVRNLTRGRGFMVLAPHPDDEVLGCGGLILQSLAEAVPAFITIVTDGSGSHPNSRKFPPPALRALRAAEAREAASRLGLGQCHLHFLGYRDTAAPQDGPEFDQAVDRIVAEIMKTGCATVFAPWRFDPHSDHLAVHVMATEAARRAGAHHLSYPVWGWILPADQELGKLTISGFRLATGHLLERKRRALMAHASQLVGIIDDDPTGFQLQGPMLEKLLRPFEVFLENP